MNPEFKDRSFDLYVFLAQERSRKDEKSQSGYDNRKSCRRKEEKKSDMDPYRKALIEIRKSVIHRKDKEKQIARHLADLLDQLDPNRTKLIGLYYPIRGEVDILESLEDRTASMCFARVIGKYEMDFCRCSINDLIPGAFHIPEPSEELEAVVPDLLLVPLVAYHNLNRLGNGQGFYDRYLAAHPDLPAIGLAFDEQEADFPVLETDQILDYLITPAGIRQKSEDD